MDFLTWHYNEGLQFFMRRWESMIAYIRHYFSFPLLITSLFSEWKRVIDTNQTGMNLSKYLEKLSFNLVSRGVGAGVRFTLFVSGLLFLVFVYIGGLLGVGLWVIFPPMGYPFFLKYKKQPKHIASALVASSHGEPKEQLRKIFSSVPGEFVLTHVGVTLDEIIEHCQLDRGFVLNLIPNGFSDIVQTYISHKFLDENFMTQKGIVYSDFLQSAQWWDGLQKEISQIEEKDYFGTPGIGLELLFGYTPLLNKFSIDLGAPQTFTSHLIGREEIVKRMERSLTSGVSILLVGMPGVGKKTVVYDFAHQARMGKLGSAMAYRRVLEFDYAALFSENKGLDDKKAALTAVLSEASYAGNIILVIKDIQKLTNPMLEGNDFTDIFEKFLEKRELKLIALSTQMEYERFLASNLRLRKFFDVAEITQPSMKQAMEILLASGKNWENKSRKTILLPSLRAILDGSDRYISETPFPEKALELLDAVVGYANQKGLPVITPAEVNIVLSEKTGVSFAALSDKEKEQLSNLEDIIHENLVNQEAAVSLIAKSLRARSAGVKEENRPVGSFMFLGPTGVGKTQTAKVLAKVYYGAESHILRFDMAEFSNKEGVTRLIGSQDRNQPGLLTTSIKNRPASLLLLDEIEKAPAEVYNLLLTLLDEGYITDAFGRRVDCRHLFVIATSNAGAEYIREQVGSGVKGESLQNSVLEHVQRERLFSPEFLNRFDGVVVYEPLTEEHLVKVAKLQLTELAVNLRKKNIFLQVTDEAAEKIAKDGFDPAFGARSMRRVIDLNLGDTIGGAIIKNEVKSGDHIKIVPGDGKGKFSVVIL